MKEHVGIYANMMDFQEMPDGSSLSYEGCIRALHSGAKAMEDLFGAYTDGKELVEKHK